MEPKLKKSSIIRSAGVVGLGTLLSRVLGLVRLQTIAYIFGSSRATDAFWMGFTLPNLLRSLLAEGALSAAFIPVFSEYLSTRGEKEARKLANNVFTILSLILTMTVGLGICLAPWYVPCLAFGFKGSPSQMDLTIRLTQVMFPFLFFISLAAVAMAILNCKAHFAAPAFAPLFFNIAIILSAFLLAPKYGIYSLAIGVLIGGAVQFLFQVPPMIKRGFVYRPILSFKDPGVKKIARLMGPTILGGITLQANVIITRIFASTLAYGSISSLQYAMRLIQLPLGLFATALSTAIFPSLSSLASEKKLEELRETTSLGIRTVFLVLIPSSVGLIIIREPLIRLLFEHGAFLQRDTLMTSQALFYYSFGLAAMGEVMILTRAFYSLQDVLTPLKVSLFILALNVLLNFLLIRPLKHSGLALATSISMLVNMLILFFLLKRRLREMEGARIINSLFKVSLISAAMGTGVRYLLGMLSSPESSSLATQAFQVSLAVIAGLVIFCSLAYLIKLEEFKLVLQALKEKGRT